MKTFWRIWFLLICSCSSRNELVRRRIWQEAACVPKRPVVRRWLEFHSGINIPRPRVCARFLHGMLSNQILYKFSRRLNRMVCWRKIWKIFRVLNEMRWKIFPSHLVKYPKYRCTVWSAGEPYLCSSGSFVNGCQGSCVCRIDGLAERSLSWVPVVAWAVDENENGLEFIRRRNRLWHRHKWSIGFPVPVEASGSKKSSNKQLIN